MKTKKQLLKKEYDKNYNKINASKIAIKRKKYSQTHKKQHNEYLKIWRFKNQKKLLLYFRKYREENRLRLKKYQNAYRIKNRKELNLKLVNRLKRNLNLRLSCQIRKRMCEVLRGNQKVSTTLKLLGCSVDKLKKYLESKFTGGMAWKNYGKWHIDHIRPCVRFDLSKASEQRKCFYYTNLQPLWAIDNFIKGAK